MPKNSKNFVFGILTILFCLNILVWLAVYDLSKPHFLEVAFFDVGQGDAVFIESPQRHQILIDGGPDSALLLEKLGREMPFWDRSIDLIILTHPEHDHLAGLIEVLKSYTVENILWTGVIRDTSEYAEWQRLIREEAKEGAKIYIAKAGQKIICSTPDVEHLTSGVEYCYFDILYPFENLEGKEVKNSNNTSVISRLVFGQTSFLFAGDAYKSVERKLIKGGTDLDSDVLKVGHHGSKTSGAEEFIQAASPEIAVISVGKDNRYDHPHAETLQALEGTRVLRTDLDGDIKIISDGVQYKVK